MKKAQRFSHKGVGKELCSYHNSNIVYTEPMLRGFVGVVRWPKNPVLNIVKHDIEKSPNSELYVVLEIQIREFKDRFFITSYVSS